MMSLAVTMSSICCWQTDVCCFCDKVFCQQHVSIERPCRTAPIQYYWGILQHVLSGTSVTIAEIKQAKVAEHGFSAFETIRLFIMICIWASACRYVAEWCIHCHLICLGKLIVHGLNLCLRPLVFWPKIAAWGYEPVSTLCLKISIIFSKLIIMCRAYLLDPSLAWQQDLARTSQLEHVHC